MQAIALGGTSAPPSQADTRPKPPFSLKVVTREDVNPAEPQAGTLPNAKEAGKVASGQNPSSVPKRAPQPASALATPRQADRRPGPAASNRGASRGAATARLEAQVPVLLNLSAEQDIRAPGASQSGPTASASAPDAAP